MLKPLHVVEKQNITIIQHLQCHSRPQHNKQSSNKGHKTAKKRDKIAYKKTDHELCVEFCEQTCKCRKADGKPCSTLFSIDHYEEMRSQSYTLTHDELDLVLMGSLVSTLHNQEDTVARSRHKSVKRQKITSCFMHNGYNVCMETF